MNLLTMPKDVQQLFDRALDLSLHFENRADAKQVLRERGYGHLLSEQMQQLTQSLKDRVEAEVGSETAEELENIIKKLVNEELTLL